MSDDGLELNARQRDIVRVLQHEGGAGVRELSDRCGVSDMTIRRDLEQLGRMGIIKRHHGGAVVVQRVLYEPPFVERRSERQDEKRRLARGALEHLPDGASIALGNGSTAYEVALILGERNGLTVLTTSLASALALADSPNVRTLLPGVTVRPREASMIGPEAVEQINGFFFNIAIIGAAGVRPQIGVTEYNADEAAVTRALLSRSSEQIVIADSRKLGQIAPVVVTELRGVTRLITGVEADGDVVAEIRSQGVEVEQV